MNDHIAGIIAKKLQGIASSEELAEWQLWMEADPGNPTEYDQMARLWGLSEKAFASPSFRTAAAWQKIDEQIKGKQERRSGSSTPRITPFVKRFTMVAATIGILLITWSIWKEMERTPQTFAAQSDHQQFYLPDSSLVLLRKGSTLHFEGSSSDERYVTLNGEAFFNVKHDQNKPFIIKTGPSRIRVLGTSFLVYSRNGADEVVVQTGKVSIDSRFNDHKEVILTAGEKVVLSPNQVQQSAILDSNYLSWNTGRLHFQSTPLPQVIHEVEHYYNIPIRTDKKLPLEGENIHITARFERQPISEVLDEIRLTAGLSIRKQGDTVVFYKN